MTTEDVFYVLLVLAIGLCVFLPAVLGHYDLAVLIAVVLLVVKVLVVRKVSRYPPLIDYSLFVLVSVFLAAIMLRFAFLEIRHHWYEHWYELCEMMGGSPAQCKLVGMILLGVLGVLAVLFLVCVIVAWRESDPHFLIVLVLIVLVFVFLAPIMLRSVFDSFLEIRRYWYELCEMMGGSPTQCKLVGMILLGVLAVLFLVGFIVEWGKSDHHPAG
jgi:hypothetical protein